MDACYEKWLWIDLIGFDMEASDCAVSALLEKVGSIPDVVSLLLQNAEFVHLHDGVDSPRKFPADVCSYGGHPHNEERSLQPWTPKALKRLVAELQRHGVSVVFSVFDSGTPSGWREHHPEVGYVLQTGECSPRICPWKRLADGTLYEDFFASKLRDIVRDYGFDGFHGADGYSHPRFPLHEADFSDDMIGQFLTDTGKTLPAGIKARCGGDVTEMAVRAKWMWAECRQAWIEFHTRRITRFWRKMADMLHAEGKMLALNTAWTRDPYEAIYRFGTDYQALAEAGADAFVVEAAGAVQELGGDLPYGAAYGRSWSGWNPDRILCRFQTTIMQIKAAVPQTKLVFLNGVKDTNEIWNGLRHAPTNLESEITMHANVFIRDADGRSRRCTEGPAVCLADGIRPMEWQWLSEVWQRAFEWPVKRVPGAVVVWSDSALKRHHDYYISNRFCPVGRLLFELVRYGAPLFVIQRIEDVRVTAVPLVILYPSLWKDDELRAVADCAEGPVFLIGEQYEFCGMKPDAELVSSDGAAGLWCGIYGTFGDFPGFAERNFFRHTTPDGVEEMDEPPSWIYELPMRPVSEEFLSACADAIAEVSGAPRILENVDSVRIWCVEGPSGGLRTFIRNDAFYYRVAKVDMRRPICSIDVQTEFPGKPILFSGSCFHVKIPGKGVVIADIVVE